MTKTLPLTSDAMYEINNLGVSEGWLLSLQQGGSDNGRFMIERDDDAEDFATDDDALEHVKRQAELGSEIHRDALLAHGQLENDVLPVKFVQLTLNVKYLCNGVDIEELRRQLEDSVQQMIGAGGLTGESEAEAETYEYSTRILPKP